MNRARIPIAAIAALALALVAGAAAGATLADGSDDDTSADATLAAERATTRRTTALVRALEDEDVAALDARLADDVTLTVPMTFDGSVAIEPNYVGRDDVVAYFRRNLDATERIAFTDEQVSAIAGGRVSFLEATGDFVIVNGQPYRNTYVFRIDWNDDGLVAAIDEYANPVAFCRTFAGAPDCPAP